MRVSWDNEGDSQSAQMVERHERMINDHQEHDETAHPGDGRDAP
jgi:hypothetical protein